MKISIVTRWRDSRQPIIRFCSKGAKVELFEIKIEGGMVHRR